MTCVSGGLAQTLWRTCRKKSCCFLPLGISSIFGVNLKMSVYCSEGFPCDTHFISSPECAKLHASLKDFLSQFFQIKSNFTILVTDIPDVSCYWCGCLFVFSTFDQITDTYVCVRVHISVPSKLS